jgi:hypothetical protein
MNLTKEQLESYLSEAQDCPYCRCLPESYGSNSKYKHIGCDSCGLSGPLEDNYEKALEAWNRIELKKVEVKP